MKALLLLSGGIDSPVAGWMVKKRMPVAAVHFSFEPLTDSQPEQKSRALAEKLGFSPFRVENISREILEITKKCERKYYFILLKRTMFRKAEEIARREGFGALVTGESLGQVSSQTLENLHAIDSAVAIPVLRPLITMDKQEIVRVAERLGTFQISAGKEVCDVLGPEHPSTRARLERVLEEERKLLM